MLKGRTVRVYKWVSKHFHAKPEESDNIKQVRFLNNLDGWVYRERDLIAEKAIFIDFGLGVFEYETSGASYTVAIVLFEDRRLELVELGDIEFV